VTLQIGLVGCGRWGLNYLRAFYELDGCRVVTACDIDPVRRVEAERRAPGLRTTGDVDALINDPEVQAVVVATEASRHFPVAKAVLAAGKHCLVEKPMTTDPAQARILRDLARRMGVVLMVGHVFRYNSAINFIQKLLVSGALGDLNYLYFTRTNLGPIRSDVNVVWDLMTHDVSILLHFANRQPAWVSAQGASYLTPGCEDVAFATLGFSDGLVANIRASWLDPRKVREITLVGSLKMVVCDDLQASEPVRIFDKGALREPRYETFGEFKLITRNGDIVIPSIVPSEPLKNQCQHFFEGVVHHRPILSDGDDGVRVVEILDLINQSIAAHGAPVWLESAQRQAA
jgi:predicted dehydrogenase